MSLIKFPRLSVTLLIALALTLLVAQIAPQQLPVSLYKLSLVTLAAYVAYWLDRELFPYGRPDSFLDSRGNIVDTDSMRCFVGCMQRRALIIAAAMVAVSLGA